MKALGIVLVILGLVAFVIPSINFTRKETVLEIGPIEAVATRKESLPVSPLLGVTFVAVGAAILVAGVITGKK